MEKIKATFLNDTELQRIVNKQASGFLDKVTIDQIVEEHYGGSFSRFIFELLQTNYSPEDGDIYRIQDKLKLIETVVERLSRLGDGDVSVGILGLDPVDDQTEPILSPGLIKFMNSIERVIFDSSLDLDETEDRLATYFLARALLHRVTHAVTLGGVGDGVDDKIVCLKLRGRELDILLL